jgi:hypothetical protein
MKTKSILCLLILTLSTLQSLPQTYDSLVVENAQWQVIWDYDETPWVDEMSGWLLRGDTLVNGLQYKKLYHRVFEEPYSEIITTESLFGFLREDAENRKVYAYDIIPGWLGCDILNQEYLLFDFSLAVGDSTQMCILIVLHQILSKIPPENLILKFDNFCVLI